jgi:hypothetical protein
MENSPSNRSLSYLQLPARLQSHILALAGAPLNTCKASAAIACSPDFTATWLAATHPRPFEAAGYLQKWGVCLHMLDSGHHITGPQLATVLSPAAAAGQVELVKRLIDAGQWPQTCSLGMPAHIDCTTTYITTMRSLTFHRVEKYPNSSYGRTNNYCALLRLPLMQVPGPSSLQPATASGSF